jgi:hypothetical protein
VTHGQTNAGQLGVSVVILSWNTLDLTRACLLSLRADTTRYAREVIVVDNGSADGSAQAIAAEFPEVRLIANPDNRLYSEGNNQGARAATLSHVCLLNSDTEVKPGALDTLLDFLVAHADYGAVAPRLLNTDGTIQPACKRFPGFLEPLFEYTQLERHWPFTRWPERLNMHDFDHRTSRDVPQPPGACMLMAREEYLALGGLDPELSLFFNDVRICRQLWAAGRKIRFLVDAEVFHHGGASTRKNYAGNTLHFRNRLTYYRKQHGAIGGAWMRALLLVGCARIWLGIWLGPKNAAQRKVALEELRQHWRRCIAA